MRYLVAPLCTVFALLLLPSRTVAFCDQSQPRLVCAEYFGSRVIVEAPFTRTESLHDKDDPEGISAFVYTLKVNRSLRGNATQTIRVYDGNDSGRTTHGGGMIGGVVNGPNFIRQNPGSEVHIDAKGVGGLFHATTDEKGEFRMNVPAGKYVVTVNQPGFSYRPFEFTYEDPDNVPNSTGWLRAGSVRRRRAIEKAYSSASFALRATIF